MTWRRWVGGAIGTGMLVCFATGCSDGEPDALTPEEAAAIAKLIGEVSVGPLVGGSIGALPADGAAQDRMDSGTEYDLEVSCSQGGSVNLSGTKSFDIGKEGGSLEVEGTIALDRCAEDTEEGATITLDGSIDHTFEAVFTFTATGLRADVDGSATGNVAWENDDDGSSGDCEVDVTIDSTIEVDKKDWSWEVQGGMTGTVCGISIDIDAKDWLKGGKKGS